MSCNITMSTCRLCIIFTLQKKGSQMSDLISFQHFRVSLKETNSVAAVWTLRIRKHPQSSNELSFWYLFYYSVHILCFCTTKFKPLNVNHFVQLFASNILPFPLLKYPPSGEYSWNICFFSQIKNLCFSLHWCHFPLVSGAGRVSYAFKSYRNL